MWKLKLILLSILCYGCKVDTDISNSEMEPKKNLENNQSFDEISHASSSSQKNDEYEIIDSIFLENNSNTDDFNLSEISLISSSSSSMQLTDPQFYDSYCTSGVFLWSEDSASLNKSSGTWYSYDDNEEKGTSEILCNGKRLYQDTELSTCEFVGALKLDFKITSDATDGTYYYGYAGVEFQLNIENLSYDLDADFSSFSGIQIEYESSANMYLILVTEPELEGIYHYGKMLYSQNNANFLWANFKQPGWVYPKVDLKPLLSKIKAIRLQAPDSYGNGISNFKLRSISLIR